MTLELSTPGIDQLGEVVDALRGWQRDDAPIQLHPGDLGWFWRAGDQAIAQALRIWTADGRIVAIGLLDDPDVLRLTVAPDAWRDEDVARQVFADVSDPQRGVLPAGKVAIESPDGTRVQDLLAEVGWNAGEPWSPLRHDLRQVEQTALQIEVIQPGHESQFTAVHRSAWGSSHFTDELWRVMAAGLPFRDGRCLLGRDADGVAVAGITVWSAGAGKPGLLEPMGVHAEHRGRGYGAAISVAGAAELKSLGSSSAMVCTLSSLTGAVATYRSAGYVRLPERLDRSRDV